MARTRSAKPKPVARRRGGEGPVGYQRLPGGRTWMRPAFESIAYSDGSESEEALLLLLRNARDVGTTSEELNDAIDGWALEAHLSATRSNLLRPLDFSGARRVLELGAGCGALTRYLGELGLEVDAVEGNRTRAECAAERCRDLQKVRVFAEEITAFSPGRKYDVVTLIGVLEYSRLFIEADDPVQKCLEIARGHLADGGVLVLAIENQLGLKYFNGCREDHLGTAFSGLTDLYTRGTAVTFGRVELESRLRQSGFRRIDWSFPFPDYKLPTTVISARGLDDPVFAPGDALLGEHSRDYGGGVLRSFDESAVWSVLERNGLMGEMANSFLVVAGLGDEPSVDDGSWLGFRFASQRLKRFAVATRFFRADDGSIAVCKEPLQAGEAHATANGEKGATFGQKLGTHPYRLGRLLARDFIDAVGRGYSPADLATVLTPWIDFLAKRAKGRKPKSLSAILIPGDLVDCIPTNIVVDDSGGLHPFDLELVASGDIPLAWVALRGTIHLAGKCFGHRALASLPFQSFLDQMLPALGFGDVSDWSPYFDLEDRLIREVLRPWKGRPDRDILRARVALPICTAHSLLESHQRLLAESQEAQRSDIEALRRDAELVREFAAWLGMLPDPGELDAQSGVTWTAPRGLIDSSDRLAAGIGTIAAPHVAERLRQLAIQRGHSAALARDNVLLAREANDALERAEALGSRINRALQESGERERELLASAEVLRAEILSRERALQEAAERQQQFAASVEVLKAEVSSREIRLREAAERQQQFAANAEVLKAEVSSREIRLREAAEREQQFAAGMEALRREISSREDGLREAADRSRGLAQEVEALRGEISSRDAALQEAAQRTGEMLRLQRREEARLREVEALSATLQAGNATLQKTSDERLAAANTLRAELETTKSRLSAAEMTLSREQGRASILAEDRNALKAELHAILKEADAMRQRLKRRGTEMARLHRHLREESGRGFDRERVLSARERERADLSCELAERERELAAMKATVTWRWSRSLRSFLGLIGLSSRGREPGMQGATGTRVGALVRDPSTIARAAIVAGAGIFDAAWYLRQNPDVLDRGQDPLEHYLETGWKAGRNPCALFHETWYRQSNAGALHADESGLEHYLRTGANAGASPNPLFDLQWYLNLYPDVRSYGPGPLHHFLHFGAREGRDPHPLFDTDWFLREYADAAAVSGSVNPLAYFLDLGLATGHSPSELFDAEWYLSHYPDVEEAGINPLVHYLEHGAREGRNPSASFDTNWYLKTYRDVAAAGVNPLIHYRIAGMSEGRLPSPRKPEAGTEVATIFAQGGSPLPASDGVREWEDYAPLKQRIEAEASLARSEVRLEPCQLVCVREDEVDAAISRLAFPKVAAPRVSIVIPVFNKLCLTLECLQSIADAGAEATFEIIIADDGSADGSASRLALIPGLVIHRNEENLGFLRNCNSAFPLARGEYVVLLNNDVQVQAGWLDALLQTFSDFDRVGAAGPRIVFPSGALQEAGVALRPDGSVEMVGLADDPNKDRYSYARPVDHSSGACLALKTSLLRDLGGFSEDFVPCYCEDSDLCLRIRQRGLRIFYQPAATVVHHLSRTTADGASDLKLRSVASSLNTFVRKWQEELDRLNEVRVLAFYLPQFHPIPENDHWWGKGFTEWSNVTRAQPNFVGHYQPRLPADLGYYDLRVPAVMEAQAGLARRYGLHGFCFYYYWFGGRRLLEKPVEQMLANGRPDIPYCLCWANENWTRRWDGEDHDILIGQNYSPEDDEAVILDLIRHFRSRRYIRIDGKPLLLVYRVTMFPDFRSTAERWRRACRREGVGEIYLAMVESFDLVNANANPAEFNCDASVEFPPLGMAQTRPPSGPVINPDYMGQTADYRDIAARFCARPLPAFTRFRGVMPGWDNTARRQNNSFCFENSTPGAFQAWLEAAIAQTRAQHHGDERIVFVNAWNEWAEGAYLEPDRRYGHAFLEAVRNAQDAQHLLRMNRYALDP